MFALDDAVYCDSIVNVVSESEELDLVATRQSGSPMQKKAQPPFGFPALSGSLILLPIVRLYDSFLGRDCHQSRSFTGVLHGHLYASFRSVLDGCCTKSRLSLLRGTPTASRDRSSKSRERRQIGELKPHGFRSHSHAAVVRGELSDLGIAYQEVERRQVDGIQCTYRHWKRFEGPDQHWRRQLQQGRSAN